MRSRLDLIRTFVKNRSQGEEEVVTQYHYLVWIFLTNNAGTTTEYGAVFIFLSSSDPSPSPGGYQHKALPTQTEVAGDGSEESAKVSLRNFRGLHPISKDLNQGQPEGRKYG